jgi:hypothetical protein
VSAPAVRRRQLFEFVFIVAVTLTLALAMQAYAVKPYRRLRRWRGL